MRLYKGGPLSAIWYLFLMGSLMIIMFLLLMCIQHQAIQKHMIRTDSHILISEKKP